MFIELEHFGANLTTVVFLVSVAGICFGGFQIARFVHALWYSKRVEYVDLYVMLGATYLGGGLFMYAYRFGELAFLILGLVLMSLCGIAAGLTYSERRKLDLISKEQNFWIVRSFGIFTGGLFFMWVLPSALVLVLMLIAHTPILAALAINAHRPEKHDVKQEVSPKVWMYILTGSLLWLVVAFVLGDTVLSTTVFLQTCISGYGFFRAKQEETATES